MWGVGGTERYWEDKKEKNGGEMGEKKLKRTHQMMLMEALVMYFFNLHNHSTV